MFRFTIRDVLWLAVVMAVGTGWWLTASRLSVTTLRLFESEAKHKSLQAIFDATKEAAAKAKMDEQFRRAYDGPSQSAIQPR